MVEKVVGFVEKHVVETALAGVTALVVITLGVLTGVASTGKAPENKFLKVFNARNWCRKGGAHEEDQGGAHDDDQGGAHDGDQGGAHDGDQ